MNKLHIIAGGLTLMFVVGGIAACSSQPAQVDVLQYGYYTPAHVYVTYPQPVIVHVSSKVYNSDHRMYSTPAYEKTYVKTHTVTRSTTTTTVNRGIGSPSVSLNKNVGSTSKTTTTTVQQRSTTTRRR